MKNYHPIYIYIYIYIYNVSFISKLSENIAARLIKEHSEYNDLRDSYQSFY